MQLRLVLLCVVTLLGRKRGHWFTKPAENEDPAWKLERPPEIPQNLCVHIYRGKRSSNALSSMAIFINLGSGESEAGRLEVERASPSDIVGQSNSGWQLYSLFGIGAQKSNKFAGCLTKHDSSTLLHLDKRAHWSVVIFIKCQVKVSRMVTNEAHLKIQIDYRIIFCQPKLICSYKLSMQTNRHIIVLLKFVSSLVPEELHARAVEVQASLPQTVRVRVRPSTSNLLHTPQAAGGKRAEVPRASSHLNLRLRLSSQSQERLNST